MGRRRGADGPQFVRYFGPVLDALRKLGGSGAPSEVVETIARDLKVPDAVQAELLPSGAPRFPNQVAWSRMHLAKAGLLDISERGVWSLTAKGRDTRLSPEDALAVYRETARQFRGERRRRQETEAEPDEDEPSVEPHAGPTRHREELRAILRDLSPEGFERLSQRLLREAGFVEVEVTGRSGDGGIDGRGTLVINHLVAFKVLFQCKKFEKPVPPSYVRDFRGAMAGRADKGLILTTSSFAPGALAEASRDGVPPIELVDGEKLIDMFEKLRLGLRPVPAFEVDAAFFEEFRRGRAGESAASERA